MSKLSPEWLLRSIDRFQQSHPPFGFLFGVVKKYGDDQAGSLAALVTYYSFLAIFPLLLLLVTILGLVAGGSHRILNDLLNSALAQFPIIGRGTKDQPGLLESIHGLRSSSPFGLTVGLGGLLWGSLGASQAGIYAMSQVWNVPRVRRPGFLPRLARSLLVLLLLAVFLGATTALTGIATFGTASLFTGIGGIALSVVVNVLLYGAAFRLLTPRDVSTHDLIPGAVIGGLGWTALQALGGLLVGHVLRHASQVYGFFGVVLGLMWWIYLGIQLTLCAAEVNVVRSRRLWPRSIVQPPLTRADREMLTTYLKEAQRRPEQQLTVGFRSRMRGSRPHSADVHSADVHSPDEGQQQG